MTDQVTQEQVIPARVGQAGRPRRTQQQRRATTQAALLAAAASLLVESGVRALTLARVGERAGYSRGIVTNHFGSKQALLQTLAWSAQNELADRVAHLPPGLDRLLLLVEEYLDALTTGGREAHVFLLLWAEAATAPELAPIFRERDTAFRAHLTADLAAGITAGTINPHLDPTTTAAAVVGQLRGIGLQLLLDPTAVDLPRLRVATATQWRRALQP